MLNKQTNKNTKIKWSWVWRRIFKQSELFQEAKSTAVKCHKGWNI